MPSPFPGMDPYLEGSLWTTFHFTFGAEIVRQLAPRLRPRYVALPVERLLIEESDDVGVFSTSMYPDLSVLATQQGPTVEGATATTAMPLRLATVIPQEVPHVSIEIRDIAGRQLVAAIEILSPTNKRGAGRTEYLTKRRRLLLSTAHLIEIDLLRGGQRVPMHDQLPPADYFVLLSRAEQRPVSDVWPIALRDKLPVVPVPLTATDADLPLDLQAAFSATYELLGYDLLVDYRQQAEPPLHEAADAWAAELLRAAGLRGQ